MPVPTNTATHIVSSYTSASAIPPVVWDAFRNNARNANLIHPHALKSLKLERSGQAALLQSQCWITCSTKTSHSSPPELDLVLSCGSWAMGDYPVFIFTPVPFTTLSLSWLHDRLRLVAEELLTVVPVERVYSVFAQAPITKTFVYVWQSLTGVVPVREPYYAALFSFCTRQTLKSRKQTSAQEGTVVLRKGEESDILKVAELCQAFASTSEPFTLDVDGALKEATELIRNRVLWVYEDVETGEFASIVATTRQSETVSAISKVYTNPRFRSQGCAERLVRRVCQHLLYRDQKESVVLYVAHDNLAAAKVYDRVGFVGLCGNPRVEGVDPWVEIGFQDTQLGHW